MQDLGKEVYRMSLFERGIPLIKPKFTLPNVEKQTKRDFPNGIPLQMCKI
jgi:hypothetical protein